MQIDSVRPLRRVSEADLAAIAQLNRDAFRIETPPDRWLRDGWVLDDEAGVCGAVRIGQLGQFYGGVSVEAAIIDEVSVRSDARGRGMGRSLMTTVLGLLCERGVAVASGLPSTLAFYRALGWEVSGIRNVYTAALARLPRVRARAGVEAWRDGDLEQVERCYRTFAAGANGLIDRPRAWWRERVLKEDGDGPLYRQLIRRDGEVRGYLLYRQRPEGGALDYYWIDCEELVWLDRDAGEAIVEFLSSQRTLGLRVEWPGPADEPFLLWCEQQTLQVRHSVPWLCRLIDVRRALVTRGYNPALDATIELDVVDEGVPANSGPLSLTVRSGHASVSARRAAPVQVDVGTLTALYTGWLHPRVAARMGGIRGAASTDLEALEAIFSGPKPWLIDIV